MATLYGVRGAGVAQALLNALFDPSTVNPTLGQATQTSDTVAQNLTLQPQAPFASAVTNVKPGDLVVALAQQIGGPTNANEPRFRVTGAGLAQDVFRVFEDRQNVQLGGANLYLASPDASPILSNSPNNGTINLASNTQTRISVGGTSLLTANANNTSFSAGSTSSANIFLLGVAGLLLQSTGAISIAAGGTFTLTAAQYCSTIIKLTGSLAANATIVLPSQDGAVWTVDATACTLNAHTITLQANSVNWGTSVGITNLYQVTYSGALGKLTGVTLTP